MKEKLTGVSPGSCHQVTRHFSLTGQQGFLAGQIPSPVKTTQGNLTIEFVFAKSRGMFGFHRANFLTDRIQGPAKTTSIKKPTDLVKILKMLDNILPFYQTKPENRKKKCSSYDWERGLGTCHNCNTTYQLHTYQRKGASEKQYVRPTPPDPDYPGRDYGLDDKGHATPMVEKYLEPYFIAKLSFSLASLIISLHNLTPLPAHFGIVSN